jgi:hypothetical protein
MTPELTPQLQQLLDASGNTAPRIVDPRTSKTYVLLSEEDYNRLNALAECEDSLSDTYPAQMESAFRAGWGDPAMDAYDHYDDHRK